MRIIADISPETFERTQRLIKAGRYASVAQAVVAALENQLLLEESSEGEGISKDAGRRSAQATPQLASAGSTRESAAPPPWQDALRGTVVEVSTASVETDALGFGPYWLWGVNRIAPVKFGLRVLAKTLVRGHPASLESYLREASELASHCGRWLAQLDDMTSRRRGERLSAGFPLAKLGSEEGSRNRYADLFLACVRKRNGRVDGALPALRFIALNADEDNGPTVAITEAGLRFAALQSPIIDSDSPEGSLSDEERDFYLEHARTSVPEEKDALLAVMRAIANEATTTQAVDRFLQRAHSAWTDKAVASLRVTILGRLVELGLVQRARDGGSASYALTEWGRRVVEQEGGER